MKTKTQHTQTYGMQWKQYWEEDSYHSFGYFVFLFSLNSWKFLIYFFISAFTLLSFIRVLFCFHGYVGFLLSFLLLKTSLRHGDLRVCMGVFQSSYIDWGSFCVQLCGQFSRRCHGVLRRRCILLLQDDMFCRYLLSPVGS